MNPKDHLFFCKMGNAIVPNPLLDRLQCLDILNAEGRTGEMLEIGVYEGEYSEQVLNRWKGTRLIGVDPFFNFGWEEYRDGCNRSNMEAVMIKMLKRMAPFGDRFNLIRRKSTEAVDMFPDETFDNIHIDGNHAPESIRADLKAWWPKVRVGGLFGGHDYYLRDDPSQLCGVKTAVDEFIKEKGLKFQTTPDTSWFTRKTKEGQ